MPLLHPIARRDAKVLRFTLDGRSCEGRTGDTLLSAILALDEKLRVSDFTQEPRAGFCQMSACQDCWVRIDGGARVRACSTALAEGMAISTVRGEPA